ncbi:membrane protein [Lysobacter daejeonensis GH1-9]|uniref:Membrane protein n=1 Tax=Lysobacter daejeonensis GH1-9 TaxID=1385517 RepID=A0A0A0F163_9GAMM|nr:YhdP family protein [Lysobacter daejeonensis]KGM56053.1 membrane protein [Lysobacter daejeonensis GH1-9]
MPTPLRRRLRLARRGLGYTVAIALVLVALLLSVASQVLPMAERNPDRVAEWLSERAGRPIRFDKVETAWTRRGPLLKLDNLRVGEGAQSFLVGDTEMLVSLYAGMLPGRAFSELRLRGIDLTLERSADGRWQVRGLPGQQQTGGDPFAALEGLGELQVIGGKLAVIAPAYGIDARIPRINLRLQVNGERVRVGARIWPRLGATPLHGMLDFNRKRGDGRVYAGAREADLAAWSSLLRVSGVEAEAGHGRAEAWGELRGHRIVLVTADAQLEDVRLRGAALDGEGGARTRSNVVFDALQAKARWRLVRGGWRVDAPTLRIGSGDSQQTLDGLLLAGGQQYAIVADRLDAAPLLQALALSDRVSPGLRRWLLASKPRAALQRIEIAGRRGGPVHARARIDSVGFDPVGNTPGLDGLAGAFNGDADGFDVQLDPGTALRFNWPAGFGVVHDVKLDGRIGGWREGKGWRIGTPALRVDGKGYAATARGGLWWQGDGTRPWIDIAADIEEATLPAAKGFWVHYLMPKPVVEWLDMALVSGQLSNGRAVVSGDLDEWPFDRQNGRFEANAHITNGVLKFQPDWPAAEGVEADASFIGNGFTVDGVGRVGEVAIQRLHAGIDSYHDGQLEVSANGAGDAGRMLEVLRVSPLQKLDPDTFAKISASGPAELDFKLVLPLGHARETSVEGAVRLKGARLADSRWNLAFDQVNGAARYSLKGFEAERLAVRHEGLPGHLSLRVGEGYVLDRANVFEAALDATLAASALLDQAPDLGWLKPYMHGRSPWTIGVAVQPARNGRSAATHLQLASQLQGTAITLPEPLRKPAGETLATTIEAPLPLGTGEVRVVMGTKAALRARAQNGRTGVRVQLGGGLPDAEPPANGLVVGGRTDRLDAIDWVAIARGGTDSGGGFPLQRIDVTAARLQLLGGVFPDTHVVVAPAADGAIAVRAEGRSLQGALLVPSSSSATIAGHFEHAHWRAAEVISTPSSPAAVTSASASASAAASGAPSAATGGSDPINPANIPPLVFDIDDLRVAEARLGQAAVRTRPTGRGMRFEQVQAHAAGQRIDLKGEWSGMGAAERTQMDIRIASDNVGALLDGFGMRGQLSGGKGSAHFDALWPGSPAGFALSSLEGQLTLDVRGGQLLEVEPGAGRVLGLLSLAQLPRRLTLDFRDFFSKGFAFDRAGGTVQFANGIARSGDLGIDGPAASIAIRGTTNLRAQTFNQTIEVHPKAGNLLTAVGAIAGGPVGAAIGAAANAVLQKPLGEMTAKTYRVTGPWKEPKVDVIREQAGKPAEEAATTGGG